MDVSTAIEKIYEACSKTLGEEKAPGAISNFFTCMMYDFQDKGIPVTAKAIEEAIIEEGEFCKRCLEKDAA